MERNSEFIQEIMKNTIILLQENDESEWAAFLDALMNEYINLETRTEAVKKIINIYKGDMGSFSDLVLQKNLKMLVEENNQLAALKHELYNACLNYCDEHQISI